MEDSRKRARDTETDRERAGDGGGDREQEGKRKEVSDRWREAGYAD